MLEVIACYVDGAGAWLVTKEGSTLTIEHPNDGPLSYTLTRAPEYDRQYWPEFRITARYGACDDWGAEGVVWIDGEAYTVNTY